MHSTGCHPLLGSWECTAQGVTHCWGAGNAQHSCHPLLGSWECTARGVTHCWGAGNAQHGVSPTAGELGMHSLGCHPLLGSCQMSPQGRTGHCSCSCHKLCHGSNPSDPGSSWIHPAPLGSFPLQSAPLNLRSLCFMCAPPAPCGALGSTSTLRGSGVPCLVLGTAGKQRGLGEGAPSEKWGAGACVAVPESWEGSWQRADGAGEQQGGKQLGHSMGKLGPGTRASGAGAEGSRWSCSFLDPAPWDLPMAMPWDQCCARATGKGGQGQHCPLGSPCPPLGPGLGFGRDEEPQLCCLPAAAGNCSAAAPVPLGTLGISSSCPRSRVAPSPAAPAPATPPPCPLPLGTLAPLCFQSLALQFQLCLSPGWAGKPKICPGLSWTL
ncbi:uncharacterized protein LOC134562051 [Prinia subflava]|uniref:uncharacterized protein LOC134562051 n=1 Tax=Prinia subflava TaxID=208062 RepID=UPI002FE11466